MKDILNPLFNSIVMEAKKKDDPKDIKVTPDDTEDKPTDYSNDNEIDETDDVKGQDYSIEDDEVTEDEGAGEKEDDPEANDYGGDGDDLDPDTPPEDEDVEPNDYGGEGNDGSDEQNTDNPEDQQPDTDNTEEVKVLFLYKDFIKLQNFIIENISKIRKTARTSYFIKEIDNQCIKNFEILRELVTNYLIFKYKSNNYTANLYNYNNFVTLAKINTQMLKKVTNSKSNR